MASNLPSENIFDEICLQIIDTFSELMKQLTDRRDQLLKEVRRRKAEFEQRLNSHRESLKQLETVRIQIEQISISQTQSSNLLQSSLAPIQKQISDLKTELVPTPNLKFECTQIPSQFRNLGAVIVDKCIDYSKKVKATHVFGDIENNSGKFESLENLYIDEASLYIINDSRIRIFETSDWTSTHKIQLEKEFRARAVATNKDHCYIACIRGKLCCIYKWDKFFLCVIRREDCIPFGNEGFLPSISLAILEDEIFVTSNYSKNICVFDLDLHYRRNFELPKIPKCIQIKENRFYVLDKLNNLHYYNIDGQLMGSSHELNSLKIQYSVNSFCFDPSGNVILVSHGQVIVVTPNGEEIYSIGKGSQCNEDISGCNSVAVFQDKLIVSCAERGNIKIF